MKVTSFDGRLVSGSYLLTSNSYSGKSFLLQKLLLESQLYLRQPIEHIYIFFQSMKNEYELLKQKLLKLKSIKSVKYLPLSDLTQDLKLEDGSFIILDDASKAFLKSQQSIIDSYLNVLCHKHSYYFFIVTQLGLKSPEVFRLFSIIQFVLLNVKNSGGQRLCHQIFINNYWSDRRCLNELFSYVSRHSYLSSFICINLNVPFNFLNPDIIEQFQGEIPKLTLFPLAIPYFTCFAFFPHVSVLESLYINENKNIDMNSKTTATIHQIKTNLMPKETLPSLEHAPKNVYFLIPGKYIKKCLPRQDAANDPTKKTSEVTKEERLEELKKTIEKDIVTLTPLQMHMKYIRTLSFLLRVPEFKTDGKLLFYLNDEFNILGFLHAANANHNLKSVEEKKKLVKKFRKVFIAFLEGSHAPVEFFPGIKFVLQKKAPPKKNL